MLHELEGEISKCTRCDLHQYRKNTVPGEGDPTAPMLIIGEAPGEEEDEQGRPFVGRCGELLRRMLVNAGFTPSMHFIINTVKCRPPGNVNPSAAQIASCRIYLLAQVSLVQPKLVLLLGNIAINALLKVPAGMGVTKLRGQFLDRYGLTFMPTFHPSYIIRGSLSESDYLTDFTKAKRYLIENKFI